MKQNRNDLCQCGSGKKYKKCCFLSEQDDSDDDEDKIGSYFELQQALANMRMMFLRNKPHIKKYKQIRKLDDEITNAMVDYYTDGKFVSQIQHLLDKHFDEDTDEGWGAIVNFVVYKNCPNLNCITEEFLKNNRYRQPDKIEFMKSMLNSRLGLYEVTNKDAGEGYVNMKNVVTGKEYKVIDIGLSGDHNESEELYYHTRIISYHGINFNTCSNMFFKKSDAFIKKYITENIMSDDPNKEFERYLQLYKYYLSDPKRARIGKINVIR